MIWHPIANLLRDVKKIFPQMIPTIGTTEESDGAKTDKITLT